MGYEVHITRAEDWTESADYPISESEWLKVVHSDPSLHISDEGTVLWLDHPDKPSDKPQFWYADGMITKKHPDECTLQKMAEIADRLNARVIDDDGAEYGEEEDAETAESPDGENQRPWWRKLLQR
jgi:hypothetical protein